MQFSFLTVRFTERLAVIMDDMLSSGQIDKFTDSTMRLGAVKVEEGQFYHPADAVI